jgi:MFS family permease
MTISAEREARVATTTSTLTRLSLFTVLSGQFLSVLDFFIVNVALPDIGADLHTGQSSEELIVAGYGLSYALLLVLGGRLGDTYGRKRLFTTGMALFTLTSLLCGLAPTAGTLIIARVVQGAAAAMMVPQVLGTIQATTSGAARAKALGIFGASNGLASVLGQLAGGALVALNIDGTGWRPIFLVNVPIGIVAMICAAKWMPSTRADRASTVDVRGTVLLAVTLLLLLFPMLEGQSLDWPLWTVVPLVASPFVAALFYKVERDIERRGGQALLPPSMLRLASLRNGLALAVPLFVGFGGFSFGYVVALQRGLGFTPMECGLALVPLGVTFLIASLNSARLVERYGVRVVTAGILVQAVGMIGLVVCVATGWPRLGVADLAPWIALVGLGNGVVMGPLFRVVLSDVPLHHAGTGGGLLSTTQQSSLALGVALLGTVFGAFGGLRDGLVAVLVVATVLSLAFAAGSRRLPDPRVAARPADSRWERGPVARSGGDH